MYIVRPKFSVTKVSPKGYPLKMSTGFKTLTITSILVIGLTSLAPANSATSLLNKSCPKVNSTKTNNGVKLICKSVAGKKLWKKTPKIDAQQSVKSVPLTVPQFNLKYDSNIVTATLIVNSNEIKNESINGAEVVVYAKTDGNYLKIGSTNWSALTVNSSRTNAVNFRFEVPEKYKGSEVAVEVRYANTLGQGEKALKAIFIPSPVATPTPTPTPTPTRTATPTPAPVTSAPSTAEVGCSVNYISPLPYASQRMAIINMVWEKDSAGYVSVVASIRNDNSMALRLVNYTFYFIHKGSVITTTSTLEGDHHFYIQDDAKFNSLDGTSGPWTPGQVRTFRIPTNQMLECRSISVSSSGYTVKQGIGAN